jgi:hypothetical protein
VVAAVVTVVAMVVAMVVGREMFQLPGNFSRLLTISGPWSSKMKYG